MKPETRCLFRGAVVGPKVGKIITDPKLRLIVFGWGDEEKEEV